jgi:hypothetical protein
MKCLKRLLLAVAATVPSGNTVLAQGIRLGLGIIPHEIGAGQGAGVDSALVAKEGRKATEKRRRLKGGAKKCDKLLISLVPDDIGITGTSLVTDGGYGLKLNVYKKGSKTVIGTWYEQASFVSGDFNGDVEVVGTTVLVFHGGDSQSAISIARATSTYVMLRVLGHVVPASCV